MATFIRGIPDGKRHKRGIYLCECGKEFIALISNIKSGHTKSCGCLRRAVTSERSLIHGQRVNRTKTYAAWLNMKTRCNNANRKDYANYGGRGITYDPRWESFENFFADMGESPPKLSLDRKDNALGYSKENCRWATRSMQGVNKRNNVFYEFNGKSQTLAEWSRETGIGRVTLLKRLQRGVPIDVALSTAGYLRVA